MHLNVEFDDNLVLKQKDVSLLQEYIANLTSTLSNVAQIELELNMKGRELSLRSNQVAQLKSENEKISAQNKSYE